MNRRRFGFVTMMGAFSSLLPVKVLATPPPPVVFWPMAGRAIAWLGRLIVGEIITRALFGNDCNCPNSNSYWTTEVGISHRRKQKLPSMPGDKYAAFGYGKIDPSGNNDFDKEIFQAQLHKREEIAMIIPESAIFAICGIVNIIDEGGWLDVGSEKDVEILKDLLLPISKEFSESIADSDRVGFKTNYGSFIFDGDINRSEEGDPLFISGKIFLTIDDPTIEGELNPLLTKISQVRFDEYIGSLDFING